MCWQLQTCQAVHNQPIVLILNRHFCELWTVCNISIKLSHNLTLTCFFPVFFFKPSSNTCWNRAFLPTRNAQSPWPPYLWPPLLSRPLSLVLLLPVLFFRALFINECRSHIHLGSTFSDGLFSCSPLAISGVLDIDRILPWICNPVSDNDRFLLD